MATFGILAGGKVGMTLAWQMCAVARYAVVDFAQEAEGGTTSAPQFRNAAWERGACWLAVGLLQGTADGLRMVTAVLKNAGTLWQPIPIVWSSVYFLIGCIGLIGVVMMQAHRDRRPNVLKWFVLGLSAAWLFDIGQFTPYPLVSALGAVLYLIASVPGAYILVMKIDKDVEQKDVQNGYTLLVVFMLNSSLAIVLLVATLKVNPLVVSGLLVLMQMAALKVCILIFKKGFGDDERKLWSYPVPAILLALELGSCLLLLDSNMKTLAFWGLLLLQEANSVLKNTGMFTKLYVAVRARLNRPVGEESLKLIEERRSTTAPCDNIGEIVSPVVIMIAIGLESVIDWLPFERAPYFANTGILGGWRNQRFRGEAPTMLIIVFFVRVTFCSIEMKVRDRQRDNETDTSATTNAGQQTPETDEDASGENSRSNEARARARRSSMAVLYHRIVRSEDALVHMRCMAAVLFALQPVLLVCTAAYVGKLTTD